MSLLKKPLTESEVVDVIIKRLQREFRTEGFVYRREFVISRASRLDIVAIDPRFPDRIVFAIEVKKSLKKVDWERLQEQLSRYNATICPCFFCLGLTGIPPVIKKIKNYLKTGRWETKFQKMEEERLSKKTKLLNCLHQGQYIEIPKEHFTQITLWIKQNRPLLHKYLQSDSYELFVKNHKEELFNYPVEVISSIIRAQELLSSKTYRLSQGVWFLRTINDKRYVDESVKTGIKYESYSDPDRLKRMDKAEKKRKRKRLSYFKKYK